MDSADLARELRAARPSAGDALRERVRGIVAGPTLARPSRFARFKARRFVLVAVPVAAVLVAAIVGITNLPDSGRPERLADAPSTLAATAAGGRDAPARTVTPAAKANVQGSEATPAPASDRAQRYSAQLTVSVKDNDALSQATQDALATARGLGGYVVSVQVATAESGFAVMTLKVPTGRVQDAITRLSSLGTIVAQDVQIDDLQGQLDALSVSEIALRGQIARLSARIAVPGLDAGTRATLVARRDAARAELAQVRAQSTQVAADARFATIHLELRTRQVSALPAPPSRFDDALDDAVRILLWEATAVLYALVVAGPLVLAGLAAWLGRRTVRRRTDERLLHA